MGVEAGQVLEHYRLIEKIGAGGMGEVWKALDTTLDREVAIKILPDLFADDAERLARFEREAKLLAALNHPGIATVHGLHRAAGVRFLAMEFVDGEDLAARTRRGPLPLDEALRIALHVAEALEAAHERGIVHRDLKPANIRIAGDGKVKVLDFGLARAFEADPRSGEASLSLSPTLTSAGTVAGVILGTAGYMSPEQARGHTADSRADVWSFGCVLYEMLTGRAPFGGDTVSDTLAGVLKLDPDWDALPAGVPPRIRRLLQRCLRKDRKQRVHHIADARIGITETLDGTPDDEPVAVATPLPRRSRERWVWAAALALAALGAWLLGGALSGKAEPPPLRRVTLSLDDDAVGGFTLSPDGRKIAYLAGSRLWLRRLDEWEPRDLGSAESLDTAFWSPDSATLAFVRDDRLWQAALGGGQPTAVCDVPWVTEGGSWGANGTIVLAHDTSGLYRVPARGGDLELIHDLQPPDRDFHEPSFLPDERGVLFILHTEGRLPDAIAVWADGKRRILLELEGQLLGWPSYSKSGHILYARLSSNAGIWALPFDLDRLEVRGEPFLVEAGGSAPQVSDDGTLAYTMNGIGQTRQLVWADREGRVLEPLTEPMGVFNRPAISPDGTAIAVGIEERLGSRLSSLWVYDLTRGTRSRVTFDDSNDDAPVWTPDGRHLIYESRRESRNALMRVPVDGRGEPEKLADGDNPALSPDGTHLLFDRREESETGWDIWSLPLDGSAEPTPLLRTRHNEGRATISPDGAYLAYSSDESGTSQVYVTQFPRVEGKWQVSADPGWAPRWSHAGDELFFVDEAGLMKVDVKLSPSLELGRPVRLFRWSPGFMLRYFGYDVSSDGQRFVAVRPASFESSDPPGVIRLIENWTAALPER